MFWYQVLFAVVTENFIFVSTINLLCGKFPKRFISILGGNQQNHVISHCATVFSVNIYEISCRCQLQTSICLGIRTINVTFNWWNQQRNVIRDHECRDDRPGELWTAGHAGSVAEVTCGKVPTAGRHTEFGNTILPEKYISLVK